MRTWLRKLLRPADHVPLGRWCHPTSSIYKGTCDQALKSAFADWDNGYHALRRSDGEKRQEATRDPITVFLSD